MADLIITPTSVAQGSGVSVDRVTLAGETILAGQSLYKKAADSRWWKAQCDTTAAEAEFVGIALNGASAGQPVAVLQSGTITIGATVAVGMIYCVSATAGGICPYADILTTNYVTKIGIGISTLLIDVRPHVSGIQKA